MPTEQIMNSLVINKVDKTETLNAMKKMEDFDASQVYIVEDPIGRVPVTSEPTEDINIWIDPNENPARAEGIYTKEETDALIDAITAKDVGAPTVEEMNKAIASIPTPDVSGQISAHNTNASAHSDIRKAISDHAENKSNPHGVTAAQVGANSAAYVYFDKTTHTTVESWLKTNVSINRPFIATHWEGYNTTDAPFTFWGMLYVWGWNESTGITVRIQPNNDGGAYERMYRSGAWMGDWNRIIHTGNKDQIFTYGTEDLTAGSSPLETGKLHFVYE